MKSQFFLQCISCQHEIPFHIQNYQCPKCNENMQVVYDYGQTIKTTTSSSIRYQILNDFAPLLPVSPQYLEKVMINPTPIHSFHPLAKELGLKELLFKDETRNPSLSFKDRASSLIIAAALQHKIDTVCTASTGNAASSLACLAAGKGIKPIIFVPEAIPQAKLVQLLVYGAKVFPVKGTYDDAFALCIEASNHFNWYNRNTGYNPLTREGKKLCSIELALQLSFKMPDMILVPVGDGNIISGLWKGLSDLYKVKKIDRLPRLVAVQAEGSQSIYKAFKKNDLPAPTRVKTIADSISVELPKDGLAALKAIKESKGFAITVTDEEIKAGALYLAQQTGIFAEPSAAVTTAALLKDSSLFSKQKVMLLVTGNGLKDMKSALTLCETPDSISPNLKSLQEEIAQKEIK